MRVVEPSIGHAPADFRGPLQMRVFWLGQDSPLDHVTPDLASDCGFQQFAHVAEALPYFARHEADGVVVRCPLADLAPEEVLEVIQKVDTEVPVILCDPEATSTDVGRRVKLGAYCCFGLDCTPKDLTEALRTAVEDRRSRQLGHLSRNLVGDGWKRYLVGDSPAIKNVERIIRLAGPRRCTVLITGETGTGKEVAARALHLAGDRARAPFVAINCSAIPGDLLESELFGHSKGAFTGAVAQRSGRFEQAQGGTLFLDEIGDMPFDLQAKLLRVLQEREFQRVGSSETIKVDVRVVAASNLNLADRVKENKFREDLYYRINVVPLEMPPLRARTSDIPALVYHFIEKVCVAEEICVKKVHRDTMDRLCRYDWPGNVRQLQNAVEMAVVMSEARDTLYPADFNLPGGPKLPQVPLQPVLCMPPGARLPDHGLDLDQMLVDFERSMVEQALERAGGNKTLAANLLRIPRTTLISKLRAIGVA